ARAPRGSASPPDRSTGRRRTARPCRTRASRSPVRAAAPRAAPRRRPPDPPGRWRRPTRSDRRTARAAATPSGAHCTVPIARTPLTRSSEAGKESNDGARPFPGGRREDPARCRRALAHAFADRARDHRGESRARPRRARRDPDARRPARAPPRAPDRGARRRGAGARRRRHHLLPRRRSRARRRRPAACAAARARDAARLPARGTDGRARRRRPLHGSHDPRGDRGALRLRPPRTRAARRARRPRPPRAADPSRLRRQEPADRAQRAHPGAAARGRRGRPDPARAEPGGGVALTIRLVKDELRPPAAPPRRHLISIADLTRDDVERLLGTARTFEASLEREVKKLPALKGRVVVTLFYESSTRTSSSFELAAKRLSADTLSIKSVGSSVDKGESLVDTARTLGAYDPDVIVIRHPQIGSPRIVARETDAHVVNAGDGKHQHPTQALLDLYTLQQELGRLEGLHVAIVGDVLHSRVAR